jgi:hypothetical protein
MRIADIKKYAIVSAAIDAELAGRLYEKAHSSRQLPGDLIAVAIEEFLSRPRGGGEFMANLQKSTGVSA